MFRKLFLLFAFFLLNSVAFGQQIRFAKSGSHSLLGLHYGSLNGPSLSELHYVNCCFPNSSQVYTHRPSANLSAWVVNPTNTTQTQVYFKASAFGFSAFSDTVQLLAGDSLRLNLPNFGADTLQNVAYSLFQGNNLIATELLPINQDFFSDSARLAHYFGPADNYIGTDALGHDNAGFAMLYAIDPQVVLTGFSIFLDSTSVAGGDILFNVYDSSAFSTSGFTANPLYSETMLVSTGGKWQTAPLSGTFNGFSGTKTKYIWLEVRLFSNGGSSPIRIGNSQKLLPNNQTAYYANTKGNGTWKSIRDTSLAINNPLFHLNTFVPHWDPMQLSEDAPLIEVQLFPNPAKNQLQLRSQHVLSGCSFSILDVHGKECKRGQLNDPQVIALKELKPGVYILQLASDHLLYTKRFIVE